MDNFLKPFVLEQDDFSSNRHLALVLCFVTCPDAKPVSTFAGHALAHGTGLSSQRQLQR
jgi:hypothetical protein